MSPELVAVSVGCFLTAFLTLLGWLGKRVILGVGEDIKETKDDIKELAASVLDQTRKTELRIRDLERWRVTHTKRGHAR